MHYLYAYAILSIAGLGMAVISDCLYKNTWLLSNEVLVNSLVHKNEFQKGKV